VWNQRNSIVEFLRGSDHIREHLLGCTFGIAPLQAMPFIEKVLGRPSAKIRASYGFKKSSIAMIAPGSVQHSASTCSFFEVCSRRLVQSAFEVCTPLLCREEMPFQAQRDELAAPIIEWVRNNPGTECNMRNGKGDLLVHVKNFYAANSKPGKTDAQLAGVITRLLTQARPGIIRPQYTNKHCKRKALGEPTAWEGLHFFKN
jgi:hypothetical protein